MDNLFAPPSEAELKATESLATPSSASVEMQQLAPPTPEELQATANMAQQEQFSTLPFGNKSMNSPIDLTTAQSAEDFARGGAQGATLNHADEIEAALRTGAKVITGKIDPTKDLANQYYSEKAPIEAQYKESHERSPGLYFTGQLAGGALPAALLTPAIAPAAAAGEGAAAAGIELGSELLGQGAAQAPKWLTAAAGDAVSGIPMGAGMALGESQHHLMGSPDEQQKLLKEVAQGAAGGSLVGLGAGMLARGVPVAAKAGAEKIENFMAEYGKEHPIVSQMLRSYKMGQQGANLGEQTTRRTIDMANVKANEELAAKIMKTSGDLGKIMGKTLEDATGHGVLVNITPDITNSMRRFASDALTNEVLANNPQAQKVFEKMYNTVGGGNINPIEAKSLMDNLAKIAEQMKSAGGTDAYTMMNLANNLRDSIKKKLYMAVPEFEKATQRFAQFRETFEGPLLGGREWRNLTNPEKDLTSGLENITFGLRKPTLSGELEQGVKMGKLEEGLANLQKNDAFASQAIGAKDIPGQLFERADIQAMTDLMRGKGAQEVGTSLKSHMQGSVIGKGAIGASNLIGRTSTKLGKISNNAFALGREQVQKLGQAASQNPVLKPLGDALLKSQAMQNEAMKNAALFSLIQTVDGRNLLKNMGLSDEEPNITP